MVQEFPYPHPPPVLRGLGPAGLVGLVQGCGHGLCTSGSQAGCLRRRGRSRSGMVSRSRSAGPVPAHLRGTIPGGFPAVLRGTLEARPRIWKVPTQLIG